jgi:hypothetical protein
MLTDSLAAGLSARRHDPPVYSTGFIRSRSADFGSITPTHPDGVAAYVTQLSPTGVYLWAVTAGGKVIY